MKGEIDMKNNVKGIVGTISLISGFVLLVLMLYTLYDSFMNGNLFGHDPLVFFAEFIGTIITLRIGIDLLNNYHV